MNLIKKIKGALKRQQECKVAELSGKEIIRKGGFTFVVENKPSYDRHQGSTKRSPALFVWGKRGDIEIEEVEFFNQIASVKEQEPKARILVDRTTKEDLDACIDELIEDFLRIESSSIDSRSNDS
jgi:hypothetical protein